VVSFSEKLIGVDTIAFPFGRVFALAFRNDLLGLQALAMISGY
jgi:hypothetical protein